MTDPEAGAPAGPARAERRARGPRRAAALALALLASSACDGGTPPPPPKVATMDQGVAARVGELRITVSSVARVAAAQRVAPAAARDLLVRDALFSVGAIDEGLDRQPSAALAIDAVLARGLLRSLMVEAEQAGPVTDDELRDTTARHWLELDRPDASRTVHALVRGKGKGEVPARVLLDAAQAIARDLAAVARDAASTAPPPPPEPGRQPSEDPVVTRFKDAATASFERAKAQSGRGDLELVTEGLPPVSADGRVLTPQPGAFDETFARTAAALQRRGDLSAPTETTFGVHVILLLERVPGHVVPAEERRGLLREEVVAWRATTLRDRLLERLRAGLEIDRSADALLAVVSVEQ